MIRRVIVENFKKFNRLECDGIPDHCVIVGSNNSGKTTLLQAIAAWSEIGYLWRNSSPDLTRDDFGNYHFLKLDLANFGAISSPDFSEIWKDKIVSTPASVSIGTESWNVGFEFVYEQPGTASIRPKSDVKEDDLEKYLHEPFAVRYISALSSLDTRESIYGREVVSSRLARGRGGEVIRNMLRIVYEDDNKWNILQARIRELFGYEIQPPSGADPIFAGYRHSEDGVWHDLSSAASGFLQILMAHAALLYEESDILLFDDPDTHLHNLLKERIYRSLKDHAKGRQIIMATHSSQLIDAAGRENAGRLLIVTSEGLKKIKKQDANEINRRETIEIVNAETERAVLYLEGRTDLDILREWASVLDHPSRRFLEAPFFVATAERANKQAFSKKHFGSLKSVVPDLRGLEIRDGDGRDRGAPRTPRGFTILYWKWYEIENYLIHPESILRYIRNEAGEVEELTAKEYLVSYLPPSKFKNPFDPRFIDVTKGKDIIERIIEKANCDLPPAEYYRIAKQMKRDEIHPEVIEKLDEIANLKL